MKVNATAAACKGLLLRGPFFRHAVRPVREFMISAAPIIPDNADAYADG